MTEQQKERARYWRTVRLELGVRNRLNQRQAKLQMAAPADEYVSQSDALKWLLDLADKQDAEVAAS